MNCKVKRVRRIKRKPDGTVSEFIPQLKAFLEQVFTKEFLEREVEVLQTHSKNKHNYSFLKEVNIHPAAKWWNDLNKIIAQGNRVNPAFHSQVISFMESALFFAALKILVNKGVISLDNTKTLSRLKDRENFLPYFYELFLAANYVYNGYSVKFPEEEKSQEIVDLYVYDDNGNNAYIECKRLSRKVYWEDVALQVFQYLESIRPNSYMISATFPKAPKSAREAREYGRRIILSLKGNMETNIETKELPTFIIGSPVSLHRLPSLPDTEYYTFQFAFNPIGIISEPKILIFRNTGRLKELKNAINDRLKKASKQMKTIERNDVPKLIAIDVTSFVTEVKNIWSPAADKGVERQIEFIKSYIGNWLSRNPHIAGVIITRSILHLNPYNYPLAIVIEPEYILQKDVSLTKIPKFEGWSMATIVK